jgi:hypothetical protein
VRWLPLWIALALVVVVGAAVGWRVTRLALAPLHTRALPGFSIGLPDGNVEIEDDKAYSHGQLTVGKLAGVGSFLRLAWEPGGLYDDGEVALSNKMLSTMFKEEARPIPISPAVTIPERPKARSWAMQLGPRSTWATQIVCGARRVTLMIGSHDRGLERLHRRIAASFRCQPDPAQEQTVGEIAVTFEVGAGWFHLPSEGDLQITNGRFVLSARNISGGLVPDEVAKIPFPGLQFDERVGNDWSFHTTDGGAVFHGWLALRPCPDGGQLLVMSMADEEDMTAARALLQRVRCRKPGETKQRWPDAPRDHGAK